MTTTTPTHSLNPYPITANASLIDTAAIATYADIVWGGLPTTVESFVNLRGIGEKGSPQEGRFRDDIFIQPAFTTDLAAVIAGHAERWGQYEVATFCIPGILNGTKGGSEAVEQMSCILLDLDTDCDTNEAIDWLTEQIGEPTMVVRSGGINGAGTPKRHLYWRLDGGENGQDYRQIEKIVGLRHTLAERCGGDPQFGFGERGGGAQRNGRAHQPIRIPGTIHAKGGKTSLVVLERWDEDRTYLLAELAEKIEAMPLAPWLSTEALALGRSPSRSYTGGTRTGPLFHPGSGAAQEPAGGLLDREIRQGAQDGISRYDAFNTVAGHYLHLARKREYSAEEAFEKLKGWVLVNMKPAWPEPKIEAEWKALLNKEIRERGPLLAPERYQPLFSPQSGAAVEGGDQIDANTTQLVDPEQKQVVTSSCTYEELSEDLPMLTDDAGNILPPAQPDQPAPDSALRAWSARRWVTEPAPQMQWIVEGLIAKGEQHMLAAQGGAGKSFTMLDLAMRIAAAGESSAAEGGEELEWLGKPITLPGTVVLVLNEDSPTTLHRRILKINAADKEARESKGSSLLERTGDRFIPLPMPMLGGAFCLCDAEGNPTQKWSEMLGELRKLDDLVLVVWDTFSSTMHGSEVDPTIVNQMMREANRICGELGAACLWLHHIRKGGGSGGQGRGIHGAEDMADAIRGSTAITGAMRQVIGIWRAEDWHKRAKALEIKDADKDSIWKAGVVKTNLDDTMKGERTLVRQNYRLVDRTADDPYANGDLKRRACWLTIAVMEAAKSGHPFSNMGKNSTDGLYRRRHQLPAEISRLGYGALEGAMNHAIEAGLITSCSAKGGNSKKWLDTLRGPYASNDHGEELAKGAWEAPDWSDWVWDAGQEKCVRVGAGPAAGFAKKMKSA